MTYNEYLLKLYPKVFGLLYERLKHIEMEIQTLDIHKMVLELKERESDFQFFTFHYQSKPYSYDVETLIGYFRAAGYIKISGNTITITENGKRAGEMLSREFKQES